MTFSHTVTVQRLKTQRSDCRALRFLRLTFAEDVSIWRHQFCTTKNGRRFWQALGTQDMFPNVDRIGCLDRTGAVPVPQKSMRGRVQPSCNRNSRPRTSFERDRPAYGLVRVRNRRRSLESWTVRRSNQEQKTTSNRTYSLQRKRGVLVLYNATMHAYFPDCIRVIWKQHTIATLGIYSGLCLHQCLKISPSLHRWCQISWATHWGVNHG